LARYALQLAEEVQFRLPAGISPTGPQQTFRQVIGECGTPQLSGVDKVQLDSFADDAPVMGNGGPNQLRGQFQDMVLGEGRLEPLLRQLDPIPLDPREADL